MLYNIIKSLKYIGIFYATKGLRDMNYYTLRFALRDNNIFIF